MRKFLNEQTFRDHFLKGILPPLILWVGEEDYLKSETLSFLRKEAPKKGLNLEIYSVVEDAASEVLGRAATSTLLDAGTLLVLSDVERCSSPERAFLVRFADNPFPGITLILVVSSGVKTDDDFIQRLSERTLVVEFPLLSGISLKEWCKNRLKSLGLEMDEKTLSRIVAGYSGQLAWLASQIDKLSLFHPKPGPVTAREVDEVFGFSVWEATQKLTQAVKQGRLHGACQAWEEQRLWGDRPENILFSLLFEASNLPGGEENLEVLYSADVSLKTGAAPEELVLPMVIGRIVHPVLRAKEEKPEWLK